MGDDAQYCLPDYFDLRLFVDDAQIVSPTYINLKLIDIVSVSESIHRGTNYRSVLNNLTKMSILE